MHLSVHVWFHLHCVWICRLTFHLSSFLPLLKHSAQGLMHSSFSSSLPGFTLPCPPVPPHLVPPIPRYPAKAGRHHTEPLLNLPDLSSSPPPTAQQHSWVCTHTHPHRKQPCRGASVLGAGSGVTSQAQWKSRELMVGDTPSGCTWLYLLLFICVVISIYSLYISSCICISICSLSAELKVGSSSVVKLRPVILCVPVLSSC